MTKIRPRAYKANPPREGKSRTTYVKVRVVPLVPMPKSVLLQKVRDSAESGVIDPEIDVVYVEYDHKYLGRRSGYRQTADKLEALQDFYRVVTNADSADVRQQKAKTPKRRAK